MMATGADTPQCFKTNYLRGIGRGAGGAAASAEPRVTYKSVKSGSSYYQMGVELAEAMNADSSGDISVAVEESQGSNQNVMEVRTRGADYVFTSPSSLVGLAPRTARLCLRAGVAAKIQNSAAIFSCET
ncbi:hypothetical protein SAMN04488039_103256 [Sulfitobacter dubius]|nr:hypothetical protein SAMN04488039_103256 [Sulfitobacter dubius]